MKSITNRKELLLVLHSKFVSQHLEKICATGDNNWFSQKEQLKDACRNGLASEILPECFNSNSQLTIPLRQINDANMFIGLQFSANLQGKEKKYSLNPYFFMQVQELN
ncbi:MAG: hypothetical protein WBP16_10010 [Ferruginibacter sp.]